MNRCSFSASFTAKFELAFVLTTLTGKNCVLFRLVQEWLVGCFDPFHMFTQSIKLYYTFHYHVLRVQMFEKCDSLNRQ